jgi:eukaryotic-like serine/threonine-protein kinase
VVGIAAAADQARVVADGTRLGKYQLLRRLATGGMAELYLARAAGMAGFEKLVVLKRILPQHAESDDFIRMFLTEARLAATLHHPNIVQVHDIGEENGTYFFTMEWVQGQDLRRLVRAARKAEMPIPLEHILHIISGVAAGLHHAHEQADHDGTPLGVVHRDVSPSNVLVTYDGGVKIVDFGIAKAAAFQSNTVVGTLKGKIPYMSPEQCRGEDVDCRSDIFSIGTLLWELTTGTRLFAGDNEIAIINRVAKAEVPLPSSVRPGYPPELEQVVMKALAGDPDQRYASAIELQIDLEDFARDARLPVSSARVGKFMRELFAEEIQNGVAQLQAERLDAATSGQAPIPVSISSIQRAAAEPNDGIEIPSELLGGSSSSRAESEVSRAFVTRSERPTAIDRDAAPRPSRGLRWALGLGVLAVAAGGAIAATWMTRSGDRSAPAAVEATTLRAQVPPDPDASAVVVKPTQAPAGDETRAPVVPPAAVASPPKEQDEPVLIGDTSIDAKGEAAAAEDARDKKPHAKPGTRKAGSERKPEGKKPPATDASKKPKWDLDNNPMPPM